MSTALPSLIRPAPAVMLARAVLVTLFLTGGIAIIMRGAYPADAAQRLEPLRLTLLGLFGLTDPAAVERAAQVARFDGQFAGHPVATALHLGAAAVWLLLTPLQLSHRVRTARPALHRTGGRLVLAAGGVLTLSGLYFGLGGPFGGWRESVVVGLVSAWFCIASGRALYAIRRGDVRRHRQWMLRALAIPLGVTVIRLLGIAVEFALVSSSVDAVSRFLLTISLGWPLTIALMEVWLWHSARTMQPTGLLSSAKCS